MESSTPEFYICNIPTQETIEDEEQLFQRTFKDKTQEKEISTIKVKGKLEKSINMTKGSLIEKPQIIENKRKTPKFQVDFNIFISAKHIFLDQYCRKAINSRKDIVKSRQEAIKIWDDMTDEHKAKYEEMIPSNNESFLDKFKYKNPKRINAYNLFIRDKLKEARENNTTQTISTCSKLWKNSSQELKSQYAKYAMILREEYSQEIDILTKMENVNIIKLTWGPFKYFLLELMQNETEPIENEYEYSLHAAEIWNDKSEEDQAYYKDKAADEKYDYINRKWEFLLHERRKKFKQPRSGFIIFADELKMNSDNKTLRSTEDFDYIYDKWTELSDYMKREYQKAAESEGIMYQEEMTEKILIRRRNLKSKMIENKNAKTKIKSGKRQHVENENDEEINHNKKGKFTN